MHGEGDIMRHLGSCGYRLSFEQSRRSELKMTVSNLAMDLRSGVRLCRVAEVLTGLAPFPILVNNSNCIIYY
jgi:abnormal spindle-like microcephaly-associated protein